MTKIPEGIYSEQKVQKIGTMSTARTQTVTDYYKCVQLDEDLMQVQILDMYGEPMHLLEKVPVADFLKRFTFEPEKFKTKKTPGDLAAEKAVATAEKHVERKEYNSAEYEYSKALKADRENVRASFGLGKLYIETGERDKAADIFGRLARQDNVLAPENKHFFNQLGIELRGLKMYAQAIEFYEKAFFLAPDDENLLFNMARAALEGGDKVRAGEFIGQALKLNPHMEEAQKLLKEVEADQTGR
ncbi:MAG: tetratricopeptide repeat protein [Candidatus Adiutrix sp.]|jgi:tetratricopeptide (TPR) repeat protein|nr:tetratricopeptide repeat protein [Candidatus Adiutrix sp.]